MRRQKKKIQRTVQRFFEPSIAFRVMSPSVINGCFRCTSCVCVRVMKPRNQEKLGFVQMRYPVVCSLVTSGQSPTVAMHAYQVLLARPQKHCITHTTPVHAAKHLAGFVLMELMEERRHQKQRQRLKHDRQRLQARALMPMQRAPHDQSQDTYIYSRY